MAQNIPPTLILARSDSIVTIKDGEQQHPKHQAIDRMGPPANSPFQLLNIPQTIIAILLALYASLLAGLINGVLLQAFFEEAVSHMTGIVSRIALKIAKGQSGAWEALESATILISFIAGSSMVGLFCDPKRTQYNSLGSPVSPDFLLKSPYPKLIILECLALLSAFFFLDERFRLTEDLAFGLAAFACGLHNGMSSNYTQYFMRTTHVTGTCTDIGLIIGRFVQFSLRDRRRCSRPNTVNNDDDGDEGLMQQHSAFRDSEIWKLKYYVTLLLGFYFGVLLGAVLFALWNAWSIFVPLAGLILLVLSLFGTLIISQLLRVNGGRTANHLQKMSTSESLPLQEVDLNRSGDSPQIDV